MRLSLNLILMVMGIQRDIFDGDQFAPFSVERTLERMKSRNSVCMGERYFFLLTK